jgi:hypothetical protein
VQTIWVPAVADVVLKCGEKNEDRSHKLDTRNKTTPS